jgi:CxxC motif-containing protein (DUF1111 family)
MAVLFFVSATFFATWGTTSSAVVPGFGDPIDGAPLALFEAGAADFDEVEEEDEGLGPGFNGRSCTECHSAPARGGSSTITEIRFARRTSDLPGGSLLQRFAISPECQEVIPDEATVIAERLTTPVFGGGLIASIPDSSILGEEDRQASVNDGITGRAHRVFDVFFQQNRIGRFGWKAQQATLGAFGADAYLNEMGITNPFFPNENAPNGDEDVLAECDEVPDPEDDGEGVENFRNFMLFLAPPPRGPITSQVQRGDFIFRAIGCAVCHRPQYQTGSGSNVPAALRNKAVNLFSDLLLHDVGTGDGIRQGNAGTNEIRTSPLWGLRVRQLFMHDGSAFTFTGAILQHSGEAFTVRQRFINLSSSNRADLLAFLNSL